MEKKGIMMTGTFTSGQVGVTDFLLETKKKKKKRIYEAKVFKILEFRQCETMILRDKEQMRKALLLLQLIVLR